MISEQSSKSPALHPFKVQEFKKKGRALQIKALFEKHLDKGFEFNLFVRFIEQLVEQMLPLEILEDYRETESPTILRKIFQRLNEAIPLITYSFSEHTPSLLYFNTLCSGTYTQGVGRFLSDLITHWLIPGKPLMLMSSSSLNFQFVENERNSYFMHQMVIEIADESDLHIIKNNLPIIAKEAKQTILAVKHARGIISLKHLTATQKASVIQENLISHLENSGENVTDSLYTHMHAFLMKVLAEEKIKKTTEHMKPLIRQRPDFFETDIFEEIKHFILLFHDRFISLRNSRHLTRLITFLYLFRKSLKTERIKEREIHLKLLKSKLLLPIGPRHVLGILVGINVLKEQEVFDYSSLFEVIQQCTSSVQRVKESEITDSRDQTTLRLFYLEIEKETGDPFTLEEIKELRKELPKNLRERWKTEPLKV